MSLLQSIAYTDKHYQKLKTRNYLRYMVKINPDLNPDLSGLTRSLQIDLDFKPWDCNPDLSGWTKK